MRIPEVICTKYCPYCMNEMPDGQQQCPRCGRDTSAYSQHPHTLKQGSMLNSRYLIGGVIGEGGFGITYIGLDTLLQVRVAIKEFFPSGMVNRNTTVSDDVMSISTDTAKELFSKSRENFLREARTLAKFTNESGIVAVRDFFEENRTVYIVMEYLDGITLKTYLSQVGIISAYNTVCLLMPVFHSLKKIHEKNLIHRDISPDNIMLVDEEVKLLDFGAAREFADERSLSVMLKHGYAPMEQYRRHGTQGAWTDVYAICATMYKCITGKVPPDAPDRVFEDDIKMPSELGIEIDPAFEAVLRHGLAVRPEERIQSIDELLKELDSVPGIDINTESQGQSRGMGTFAGGAASAGFAGNNDNARLSEYVPHLIDEPESNGQAVTSKPQPTPPQPVQPKPAPQQAAPQPVQPKPAPQQAAPQPVQPKPAAPQPAPPQPVQPKPAAPQPAPPQPVQPKPAAPQPAPPQPVQPKPAAPQPAPSQPDDQKTPGQPPKKKKGGKGIIIVIVVFVVLLLVAGGVAAAVIFGFGRNNGGANSSSDADSSDVKSSQTSETSRTSKPAEQSSQSRAESSSVSDPATSSDGSSEQTSAESSVVKPTESSVQSSTASSDTEESSGSVSAPESSAQNSKLDLSDVKFPDHSKLFSFEDGLLIADLSLMDSPKEDLFKNLGKGDYFVSKNHPIYGTEYEIIMIPIKSSLNTDDYLCTVDYYYKDGLLSMIQYEIDGEFDNSLLTPAMRHFGSTIYTNLNDYRWMAGQSGYMFELCIVKYSDDTKTFAQRYASPPASSD